MEGPSRNAVYISCAIIVMYVSSASGLFLMPDFVSPWKTMFAQNSTITSYLKLAHGLGEVPLLVDVQVKVTSGDNADFIFQAQGCRPRDYYESERYGGVIYRYNEEFIEISTPKHDHSYSLGSIVYTGLSPYWEGKHTTNTYTAMVLVRAWKASSLPPPDFSEKNINISSGFSDSTSYIERTHGLQTIPTFVISRTKLWSGSQKDYYSDSIGSTMVMYDQSKTNQMSQFNGFVLYGFNDTVIRAWASSVQNDSLFEGGQGWHFSGYSHSGELELFAWTASSLGPDVTTTVDLGIGVSDLTKSFSQVASVDNTFSRAWVEASGGPNDGYRFVGSGSLAYETSVTADGCSYGGLVYAFSDNEVRFWQPGAGDGVSNGALVCIPNAMGNGQNVQATSEGQAVFHVWKLDIDECATNADDCDVNAICLNTQGSFDCTCNSGYSGNGQSCSDIDECATNADDCDVNAMCSNTQGSFDCTCNSGYSGNGQTCSDIDECATDADDCDVNASCSNTQGSFDCSCNSGYSGNGQSCSDIDECATNADDCDVNASCSNTQGSFDCTCNSGYSGNGQTCSDIDECVTNTDDCDLNASCSNTQGSFDCTCNSGYSGNGLACSDIDECATNADDCDVNAGCSNTQGSFDCTCNSGYSGNGQTCSDIEECSTNTDDCDVNASCSNTQGSFDCYCNSGYSGNGQSCSDIDECATNADDCDVNASCSNTLGSFDCTCNSGYSGNGQTCSDDDECKDETHTCSDKAVCTNTVGSFTCSCDTTRGFFGQAESCFEVICYPNNTINVNYLPANYHYFAMQNVTSGNDVKCTVNEIDSTSVSITECSKDLPILLTYGTYSGMETNLIHGGKSVLTVVIICHEVPELGNIHSINRTFSASLTIDEKSDINPSYQVTSALSVSSATVGSPVGWTISFPVEYTLEVTNCIAYPGTNDDSPLSVALLTNGGCTSNSELVTHFTDNKDGTAFATIQAFKFFESDDVFLKCSLKMCPAASQDNCNTQCSRQKRSAHKQLAGPEDREDKTHLATVHNVLKIVDPSASASSENSKAADFGLWMLLMTTLMNLSLRCTCILNASK